MEMHVLKGSLLLLLAWLLAAAEDGEWKLIWEDNFDTLDMTKWDHEITAWGGGNNEFEFYSNNANSSYAKDGILYILPTLTVNNINPLTNQPFGDSFLVNGTLNVTAMYGRCTNPENSGCYRTGKDIPPIMSGRIRTYQHFSYKYGKADIRAKMPTGDWLWPAIWMLPEGWEYGPWPKSGEIDIIESIGNPNLKSMADNASLGVDKMGSTLHWGPAGDDNKWNLTHASRYNKTHNYGAEFHLFTLEWDENALRFFVDGQLLLERPEPPIDQNSGWKGFWDYGKPWKSGYTNPWVNGSPMAPFDKEFHFLLNVAVGGTNGFIPDDVINRDGAAPKPWNNTSPTAMQDFYKARDQWYNTWMGEDAALQVDWIKVYQRESTTDVAPTAGATAQHQMAQVLPLLVITAVATLLLM